MLVTALSALEHDAFVHARTAVRETSQILGFRDPAMWKGLSRHMKDDGVKAENVFRHMEAVRRLREKHPEPIRHHIANLLVEMAYHGYSELKR